MPWWVWFLLGLVLAALELQVPTNFYLLAFGTGAGAVGLLVLVGAGGPAWLQWLLFSGFSVAAVLVFQRTLVGSQEKRAAGAPEIDTLVGESAMPDGDLAPGATGRAQLRGTVWTARNAGAAPITRGQRCRVTRVEGLTIWIEAE